MAGFRPTTLEEPKENLALLWPPIWADIDWVYRDFRLSKRLWLGEKKKGQRCGAYRVTLCSLLVLRWVGHKAWAIKAGGRGLYNNGGCFFFLLMSLLHVSITKYIRYHVYIHIYIYIYIYIYKLYI